jgi:hypothetical protein
MSRRQTTIATTGWLQQARGGPSMEEPPSRGRGATTLVITALAILMMVVL